MANVSGAVQIETGIKHGLSIPLQSVAGEQSIDVGTLLILEALSLAAKVFVVARADRYTKFQEA
jgi:hypothetical protein